MRRIICIGMVILTAIVSAKAQNDVLFSQHMLNRLAYNPAVTGSSRYVNVSGNFRDQWHGWRGAPR
ncbi:MAG: type IX secretion system membrane protein PorP/SprF, partial [Odoribacter sp.]